MSKSMLRLCSSSPTLPDFSATNAAQASDLGNPFTIVAATVAAAWSNTEFVRRVTTSDPGPDTRHMVIVVILVIIIAWLRLRYGLAISVTVVLATAGCVPHAARRGGWRTHHVPGLVY
jgi:hypothetical protein